MTVKKWIAMSRYRKIDPRIWNDEKFSNCTDDAQLIFIFLLTHPHLTPLGAMRATPAGLAAERHWSSKRFQKALTQLCSKDMVQLNEKASYVGLQNFLRYNEPEGPNSVTKAWIQCLDFIPECEEKRDLLKQCRAYLESKSDAFKDAMGDAIWDAFSNAMSDPRARARAIAVTDTGTGKEEKSRHDAPPPGFAEQVMNDWNVIDGVKPAKMLTADLQKRILARWHEHPDDAWWKALFGRVAASSFLTGQNDRAWAATLDWTLTPKNLAKIESGNYDCVHNGGGNGQYTGFAYGQRDYR